MSKIIRAKRESKSFALVDKNFINDKRLSYKAKGILIYIFSKPDDWKVVIRDLINNAADGKASIYAGLKELERYGYYVKEPVRDEDGRRILDWTSIVYEVPVCAEREEKEEVENQDDENQEVGNQKVENQEVENQEVENQDDEKWDSNNNNIINNYENKNYISNNDLKENKVMTCLDEKNGLNQMENVMLSIKHNIDYQSLEIRHKEDIDIINSILNIIADVLFSDGESVHILGEDKPRELVKRNLLKLNTADIEYVLEKYKALDVAIKKKEKYILAMLYSAPMERSAYYINLANANWEKEIKKK